MAGQPVYGYVRTREVTSLAVRRWAVAAILAPGRRGVACGSISDESFRLKNESVRGATDSTTEEGGLRAQTQISGIFQYLPVD